MWWVSKYLRKITTNLKEFFLAERSFDMWFSYYRPQKKFWGKVDLIFSEACVKNSVHRVGVGGVVSQHTLQVVSQHALQVSGGVVSQHALQVSSPHPRGKLRGLAWGVSRPTPRGEVEGSGLGEVLRPTSRGVSRSTPRGVSRPTPGGYPSMHWGRHTPADGYCCGWYTSYWNAFLFVQSFDSTF